MNTAFRPVHVVTMVVAVCAAAVLAPVAVSAATGTLVNVIDPYNSAYRARVSAKGTLSTDERDPYTGTAGRVSADGRRLVGDGSGALSVDMTIPGKPLGTAGDVQVDATSSPVKMFSGVGHNRIALTSMILAADASAAGTVRAAIVVYVKANTVSADCHALVGFTALGEQFKVNVVAGETVNLTWPSPLVLSGTPDADDFYCVDVVVLGGPTGHNLHVAAYGFTP